MKNKHFQKIPKQEILPKQKIFKPQNIKTYSVKLSNKKSFK